MESQVIGAGGAITIPAEILAKAHLAEGSVVCVSLTEDGAISIAAELDPDQAWFWTEEWQKGEREADEDIAAGRVTRYLSDEDFERALRSRLTSPD
ncbi:MAG: AbrB family transcriptional regulator [Dehalococcoidia bacterium]